MTTAAPLAPHPEFARLRAALERLSREAAPFAGVVFRSVSPRFAEDPDILGGVGAQRCGGRWNPPQVMPAVYASLTPEAALAETTESLRRAGIPPEFALPRVFVALRVRLPRVLHLTDGALRRRLRVSRRRMVQTNWRREQDAGREALTQALGRAAFVVGLEGLVVPSAATRRGENLVAFPGRLRGDGLRVLRGGRG